MWAQIASSIQQYWLEGTVTVAGMVLAWLSGYIKARNEWERRQFFARLNISLNTIDGGKLLLRTLVEKSVGDILINPRAVAKLRAAAKLTTEEAPLIPLPKDEAWHMLNCVLNEVSERFSTGYMRRDLGYPVKSDRYLVCLTCERATEMRTSKIRAMVIKKSLLSALPKEEPKLESETHRVRFKTLKRLAEAREKDPGAFLELEICL